MVNNLLYTVKIGNTVLYSDNHLGGAAVTFDKTMKRYASLGDEEARKVMEDNLVCQATMQTSEGPQVVWTYKADSKQIAEKSKETHDQFIAIMHIFDDLDFSARQVASNPEEEATRVIPSEYMTTGSYEGGGGRKMSPFHNKYDKLHLEEIECPACGKKHLRNKMYGDFSMCMETYNVGCDNCDWECPTTPLNDCGESICEFKEWMEAFELLSRPKSRLTEDLTLLFYPEEWRSKLVDENGKRDWDK